MNGIEESHRLVGTMNREQNEDAPAAKAGQTHIPS